MNHDYEGVGKLPREEIKEQLASLKDIGVSYRSAREKIELPELTGLRFLAAISVAMAHGSILVLRPYHAFDPILYWLGPPAGFGMTCFFVLSGFVIHYNYGSSISSKPVTGTAKFVWARFARLYPLFLLVILADIIFGPQGFHSTRVKDALPYFLSFTQSWTYTIIGHNSLIYQVGNTAPLTWSISTEWFFYLSYPLILYLLHFLKRPIWVIGAAIVVSIFWASFCAMLFDHIPGINFWAVAHFGKIADWKTNNQDSFVRWLLYFSPYVRIGEFILGCLTAQLYLVLADSPVRHLEKKVGKIFLYAAAASIPFLLFVMYTTSHVEMVEMLSIFRKTNTNFGLAPSMAFLIFCSLRYKSLLSRWLSGHLMVKSGNASYSIYLIHFPVFLWISHSALGFFHGGSFLVSFLIGYVLALCLIVVISMGLYLIVEAPARAWLRNLVRSETLPSKGFQLLVVTAIGYMAVIGASDSISRFNALMRASNGTSGVMRASNVTSGIFVVSATYGENCGAPQGNATSDVRMACNALKCCSYTVDVSLLGDPSPGCGKGFSVEYICKPGHHLNRVELPGEAGFGSKATLNCQ